MLRKFRRTLWVAMLFVLAPCLLGQTPGQQHHPPESNDEYINSLEDPGREAWQMPQEVMEKLALKPGDRVADIGAGSGYFTVRFAQAVGPSGTVYAVDIASSMLDYIRQRVQDDHLKNIVTVLAEPYDPKLKPASVDLIFICDTLHHISHRAEYYPLLAQALKPGGRLVNIDFQKRDLPLGPPVKMKIAKKAMIEEVKPAGFHLIQDHGFLPYQYFLVFEH